MGPAKRNALYQSTTIEAQILAGAEIVGCVWGMLLVAAKTLLLLLTTVCCITLHTTLDPTEQGLGIWRPTVRIYILGEVRQGWCHARYVAVCDVCSDYYYTWLLLAVGGRPCRPWRWRETTPPLFRFAPNWMRQMGIKFISVCLLLIFIRASDVQYTYIHTFAADCDIAQETIKSRARGQQHQHINQRVFPVANAQQDNSSAIILYIVTIPYITLTENTFILVIQSICIPKFTWCLCYLS